MQVPFKKIFMNGGEKMSRFSTFALFLLYIYNTETVKCWNYNAASLTELSLLTKEGKQLWDSLTEKVDMPRYGPCWKAAVSDLRLGCKFLSENVQSDLALRFTDCFMQMSGYEPMSCTLPRSVCLKQLSDRAFNAYTEFYTHTQSICYFLQSQNWHEETQKTVDKLSETSMLVSAQLAEAGLVQEKILNQQKETLSLQHNLIDYGKNLASALEISEEKIYTFMGEFHDSATEQKKLFFDLFEKFNVLHSWTIGEMSWINSLLFYLTYIIIAYLFTSMSSTKQARMYVFLLLTLNYCLERFIESVTNPTDLGENISSWIWFCRKGFIIISALIIIYTAMVYMDYNTINYKILLEIKDQNNKILKHFDKSFTESNMASQWNERRSPEVSLPKFYSESNKNIYGNHTLRRNLASENPDITPVLCHTRISGRKSSHRNESFAWKFDCNIDDIDNVSLISEKSQKSVELEKRRERTSSVKRETPYNLRSTRSRNRS